MTSSIDGLISGLNSTDIITKLMQIARQPQVAMQQQQATLKQKMAAYQSVNSKMQALGTAADALGTAAGWSLFKASSSSATNVVATASAGALGGSLSFVVNSLASAGASVSTGSASSLTSVIASSSVLVAKGGSAYGLQTVAGSGLTDGSHSVSVTQSSAGASVTGTGLGSSTVITSSNNTITANVDGAPVTYTIAAGTYTPAGLASAVQTASGGALAVSANNSNGLVLTTTNEGSAHSLQITGGTGLASLGLTAGAAVSGTDGILKADNGATVTLNDVQAGGTTTLTSDTGGTVAVTLSGGLRAGTLAAKSVNVGDGTLSSVVSAINNSGMGVNATAVQTASSSYKLQLSSTTTGAASAISIATGAFAGVGSLTTLTQASDASITVGSGPGAYQVSSASNTVTTLLPGVTLSLLKADPATPVTVSVSADSDGLADNVQKMVDAANAAVAEIKKQTAYNATAKTAGLLLGDPVVGSLQNQIAQAVTTAVGGGSLSTAAQVGLSIAKDGTFSFDKSKFQTAYTADPLNVRNMFEQGGTTTNSAVSVVADPFKRATDSTNWAVNITAAATRAQATGATLGGGTLSPGETISLRMGGTTISYTSANNDTLASIATGLNNAITSSNLGLSVSVVSNALVVKSTGYGAGTSFDMMSDGTGSGLVSAASTWETHAGTDVAGTINGVTGIGSGQVLSAPPTDPLLGGLTLKVTAPSAGSYGSYTYASGIAQRLSSRAKRVDDTTTGSLTTSISGAQSQIDGLDKSILSMNTRLDLQQADLQRQFASLESSLSSLKAQGNYLAGQIANLG
ncbi:MAG: flagellar hook-associated protein 2, partial [Acidimicrobiaceae bacterium]|nr:flagellar hook-associated protein 2 [Acidimicrobiaceae bacterium]